MSGALANRRDQRPGCRQLRDVFGKRRIPGEDRPVLANEPDRVALRFRQARVVIGEIVRRNRCGDDAAERHLLAAKLPPTRDREQATLGSARLDDGGQIIVRVLVVLEILKKLAVREIEVVSHRVDRAGHDRMAFRIDHEHVAELRQGRRQTLEPLVITQFGEPDFLVAHIADQLIDVDRRDLEGLEHLGGVLGNGRQRAVKPVLRVDEILPVGDHRSDREHEQRQDDRCAQQPPQRALRAPGRCPALSRVWGCLLHA